MLIYNVAKSLAKKRSLISSTFSHLDRCLRKLVVVKETRPATNQRAKNRGIELYKYDEIERLGAQKSHPELPPKASDLCTVCYTSGTTGNPKGVMLTHQSVIASICAVQMQMGDHRIMSSDTLISFLPLAHMLERCCENAMYMMGGSVGFYSGDIKRLAEDMKALKPTVMPAVPRLLNRMYDKVSEDYGPCFSRECNPQISAEHRDLFNIRCFNKCFQN